MGSIRETQMRPFIRTIQPKTIKPSARRATSPLLPGIVLAGLALAGCSNAKLVSVEDLSNGAASRPAIVHVADFEVAPDGLKSEALLASLSSHSRRKQSQARSLVDTMGESIVQTLAKKGIAADRLPANGPLPTQGWLVRGMFMKVDEGSRLGRAIIGFGGGQTDLEVSTSINDLSAATAPTPLYQVQADARSGKMPGAVITLNPAVAATKFVLAGYDLNRSTRKTAEKIADEIATWVKRTPQGSQHDAPPQTAASPSQAVEP